MGSNTELSTEINALREFVVQQGNIPYELQLALRQTSGEPVYTEEQTQTTRSFLNRNKAGPVPQYRNSPLNNGNGGARSPRGTPHRNHRHKLISKPSVGYHRLVAAADNYAGPYFKRKGRTSSSGT